MFVCIEHPKGFGGLPASIQRYVLLREHTPTVPFTVFQGLLFTRKLSQALEFPSVCSLAPPLMGKGEKGDAVCLGGGWEKWRGSMGPGSCLGIIVIPLWQGAQRWLSSLFITIDPRFDSFSLFVSQDQSLSFLHSFTRVPSTVLGT